MALRRGEINLYVTDLDRAARFYRDGLGLQLCESEAAHRKLTRDDVTVTLFVAKDGGRAAAAETTPSMTCDLQVDDLDTTVAALRKAGGQVDDIRTWEGGRWTQFRDLDGISWELLGT